MATKASAAAGGFAAAASAAMHFWISGMKLGPRDGRRHRRRLHRRRGGVKPGVDALDLRQQGGERRGRLGAGGCGKSADAHLLDGRRRPRQARRRRLSRRRPVNVVVHVAAAGGRQVEQHRDQRPRARLVADNV
jgi:ABC-type glutathione transport system ATPase component